MPSLDQRLNTPATKDQLRLSFSTAILMARVMSSSVKSSNAARMLSRIIGDSKPILSSYARNASDGIDDAAGVSQSSSEFVVPRTADVMGPFIAERWADSVLSIKHTLPLITTLAITPYSMAVSRARSSATVLTNTFDNTRSLCRSSTAMYLGYPRCRSNNQTARSTSLMTSALSMLERTRPNTAFGTRVPA